MVAAMLERNQIDRLAGCEVHGPGGQKIGKVAEVYLDDQTGQPDWVTVSTGLFGTESFIPLQGAFVTGDGLSVPYDKEKVKDAPNIKTGRHLSPEEEQELYRYYDVAWDEGALTTTPGYESDTVGHASHESLVSGTEARDRTRGKTGDATGHRTGDDAMTLSEERVKVGKERQATGRARLRKYVVTEQVTQTIPVRKEKAVLEREPIDADSADRADSSDDIVEVSGGPGVFEEGHEIVLSEERPVISKVTEPVERVRLGTEQVTEEETVTEQVRKERLETEGDIADGDQLR
jgi:uncharacterized protein (TIGR02271 family)